MREINQLSAFNAQSGRPVAILHAYSGFEDPFPIQSLTAIERNGSIPLLDWSCANVQEIASGARDGVINTFARQVRAFGRPMFLRWYWEMNLDGPQHSACGGFGNGSGYIAAWRRIHGIFTSVGATNAAFVWCPSGHGDVEQYYPGDAYVDWICADKYDRHNWGEQAFSRMFGPFFAALAAHGKPFMVGETGAPPEDQAAFIRGIERDTPTRLPQVKAIVFFDAVGKDADWSLRGDGMAEFRHLASDPYFSFRGN
jgi:beta-mannanase